MALWGNNDNVGTAGSVSVNYATKTVTGGALTGQTGTLFGETGKVQAGDVISFGVKTKPGTYFGDAIVVSIASTTSLFSLYNGCLPDIGSTIANLSCVNIAFSSENIPLQSGPRCLIFFDISNKWGLKSEVSSFRSKAQVIPHI